MYNTIVCDPQPTIHVHARACVHTNVCRHRQMCTDTDMVKTVAPVPKMHTM